MSRGNLKFKKVFGQMASSDLGGLIIYSNGTHGILRPAYFHYFSGLRPLGHRNAVVISKLGKVVLLIEPEWDSLRASQKTWISDVRGSSNFDKDLQTIIQELKIVGSVGIAGTREMPEAIYNGINRELKIESADKIIEEIAREKTEREIGNVRKTARIADIGFNQCLEKSRIGIREYELAAEVGFAMRAAGADDVFFLLSSERHNHALHSPTDKRLNEGDVLIAEISPVCDGQVFQICRTIFLGDPNETIIEKYGLLMRALEESIKVVRPGVPASVISKTMNKLISDVGYAKYCFPPYMRARGHGFGVGSIAPGSVIDDDTSVLLEQHQVIVVHPNQYFPETGYLACGVTVLITDSGVERISTTETKLYVREA